ncbi:MAG: hypothetical protein R3D98_14905 [Candidatus Krumholzibacteriia bacterium]
MSNCIRLTLALLLLVAGAALADPVLRWAPSDTLINTGDQATLSVMLDEPLDVRTIELRVAFDPAVVTTVSGGYGALFNGFNNFDGFEEEAPGQWHGYCVILGASDWTTGPGELFTWTVEGLADGGTCPITTVELTLLPPGGGDYPDAVLTDDQIRVLDPTGLEIPTVGLPRLALYPNPFNPRTTVEVSLPGGGVGSLEVLDLRGRVVARPWSGVVDATAPLAVSWDGVDTLGQALPSGVYTFRLVGSRGQSASVRGVLVR